MKHTNKNTKKILALVLSALMLLAALVACADPEDPKGDGTKAPNGTGTATDTVDDSGPNLPDIKFTGRTITSASSERWEFVLEDDTENQEALSAAKYRAGANVEERFDIELASWLVPDNNSAELATRVIESAMAGDYEYDYVFPHVIYGVAEMIIQNCLVDYNTLKYVDMEKPWWYKDANEQLALGDKSYYATGDLNVDGTSVVLYVANKALLNDIGYDKDLYQVVFDGDWTCDEVLAINALASKDLDGDLEITPENDQYGTLLIPGYTGHVFALGQRLTERNADGLPEFVVNTPHMYEVIEKFAKLAYDDGTYFEDVGSSTFANSEYYRIMKEGRAVLMNTELGMYRYIRGLDFDYLLLPLAKYDDKQEDYMEYVGTGLIGVCATNRDMDCADAVLEALSYEYHKIVRPAFYNDVLGQKVAQDENSQKMLDLMFDSIVYDPGINYEQTLTADTVLYKVAILRKGEGASSFIQKIEGTLDMLMKNMHEKLYNR